MPIIEIILPLILVALSGYITAKKSWLNRVQIDGISKITFYLFIPAFLFYQMAIAEFSAQINLQLFAAFYLPVLLCFCLAGFINFYFHHQYKKNHAASVVFALTSSYSNTIIVGLPVLLLAFGDEVLAIIFLIVTFHSAMLFSLTNAIAIKEQGFSWRVLCKQLFYNPLIASILAGALVNVLPISLPSVISESLILISKPAITLALFVLGASLAFYQVKKQLFFISIASLIKMIILPFIVYIAAHHIFSLPHLTVTVLVIMSACPTGVNAYLQAKTLNIHRETTAGTIVVSTISAIITIPCWLWWLS